MHRFLCFLLAICWGGMSLTAQMTNGTGSLLLTSAGTAAEVEFQTTQIAARWNADTDMLSILCKPLALALEATPADRQAFEAVMRPTTYPLMRMQLALAEGLQAGSYPVRVQMDLDGAPRPVPGTFVLTQEAGMWHGTLTTDVSLAQLGLDVPAEASDRFGRQITILARVSFPAK